MLKKYLYNNKLNNMYAWIKCYVHIIMHKNVNDYFLINRYDSQYIETKHVIICKKHLHLQV